MKGYLAMQKMDLICDEYIREAEIDTNTAMVVPEKGRFWKGFARFMNSPVGVAMLCAVVSLSVLAAIVMAGTGKWGGWFTPAGTTIESETESNRPLNEDILPIGTEVKLAYSKELVAEFLQVLADTGVTLDTYEDRFTYNVTPPEIFEATGVRIFNTPLAVYFWLDREIYILNPTYGMGTSLMSAVLCDYDLNGTTDILLTYTNHLSGTSNDRIAIFDMKKKQTIPYLLYQEGVDGSEGQYIGALWGLGGTVIDERRVNGQNCYDVYNTHTVSKDETGWLMEICMFRGTLIPDSDGQMKFIKAEKMESETETPPPINEIPELVPTVLSQYLDAYGFVGGLSEGEYIGGVLGKFSYDGTPLAEFPILMGDGELEDGGFVCVAQFDEPYLSFVHSSSYPQNGEDSYAYSLRTQVPLEGFALPYNLEFGMTFAEAWEIMGLGDMKDIGMEETVLYRVGNQMLTAYREFDDPDALLDAYRIKLIFTETAQVGTETRSITISFKTNGALFDSLYEMKISVSSTENTSFGESTPPESGTEPGEIADLSPDVEAEIKQAFLKTQVDENHQKIFSVDDLSLRYYGEYGGGYVMFVDGIFFYTQAITVEVVQGYRFTYSSSQHLWYYKDGMFYTLSQAAWAGHLSQADVGRLYEVYTN